MASISAVEAVLSTLPPDQVLRFDRRFKEVMASSYTASLWGAAYVMNGGCSDDCFEYFRAWLIAHGRHAYEQALANPDSLAELAKADAEFELEELLYCASRVYETKTGKSLPDLAGVIQYPKMEPVWDFDDEAEMQRRYPKLVDAM